MNLHLVGLVRATYEVDLCEAIKLQKLSTLCYISPMRERYSRYYFSGQEESGYQRGVYGEGFIWQVKFFVAALHTRCELLRGKTSPLLLDIGGANGAQGAYFDRMGFKSVTLDISSWARKESRNRKQHVQGDGLFLPFADNSFDAVYCNDLMEHFTREDAKELLIEAKRVLKPEGVGILVPVTDLEARRKGETDEDNKRKGHISLFPRNEWKRLIESAGFVVEKQTVATSILHTLGRLYILKKAWIPTARDGIFIVEKPISEADPSKWTP